jgi:hypothetical protein
MLVCVFVLISSWSAAQKSSDMFDIRPKVWALTMVMLHDVESPPSAARYYAYCMAGAYEIVTHHNKAATPLNKIINYYEGITISANDKDYDHRIAAVYSILETGRLLLPSGFTLEKEQKDFIALLKKQKFSDAVIDRSVAVAKEVSEKISQWSQNDN